METEEGSRYRVLGIDSMSTKFRNTPLGVEGSRVILIGRKDRQGSRGP